MVVILGRLIKGNDTVDVGPKNSLSKGIDVALWFLVEYNNRYRYSVSRPLNNSTSLSINDLKYLLSLFSLILSPPYT